MSKLIVLIPAASILALFVWLWSIATAAGL